MPISQIVTNSIATGAVAAVDLAAGAARANFGAGAVLQVVSATSSVDVTTTSSATVITASITPSSASNKILAVFAGEVNNSPSSNAYGYLSLARTGSTLTGPAGVGIQTAANLVATASRSYLDSPATTSSVTYTLSVGKGSGGTTSTTAILGATITLMEIAA